MNDVISKELLSEVLGISIKDIYKLESNPNLGKNDLPYSIKRCGDIEWINIHELAHMCKEWTYTQGYVIITWNENPHFFDSEWQSEIFKIGEITANKRQRLNFFYWLNSEPEAIFAACQWILDNKESTC